MSFILGLDVSTTTIGIALFENVDGKGELKLLTHISPKVKPEPDNKFETLIKKAQIFEKEFLEKYADIGIEKVVIEEPLLGSNNVYTVATLLRFNGMISRSVYEVLGITPEFISSYDSRKYAFPELMAVRTINKKGEDISKKKNGKSVLFGAYPTGIDKKLIIWEKVSELEPQIIWIYDKHNKLKKESFDLSDAYTCVRGIMKRDGLWK